MEKLNIKNNLFLEKENNIKENSFKKENNIDKKDNNKKKNTNGNNNSIDNNIKENNARLYSMPFYADHLACTTILLRLDVMQPLIL